MGNSEGGSPRIQESEALVYMKLIGDSEKRLVKRKRKEGRKEGRVKSPGNSVFSKDGDINNVSTRPSP